MVLEPVRALGCDVGLHKAGLAAVVDGGQDLRDHIAAVGCGRLSDTGRAQGHRLHADPDRSESRRLFRAAATARRRHEIVYEGNHHTERVKQIPVRNRSHHGLCPGAGGLGSRAVRPRDGAGQCQCRAALYPYDDLAGNIRHPHRRLGIQLQVCFYRCRCVLRRRSFLTRSRWASRWYAC